MTRVVIRNQIIHNAVSSVVPIGGEPLCVFGVVCTICTICMLHRACNMYATEGLRPIWPCGHMAIYLWQRRLI